MISGIDILAAQLQKTIDNKDKGKKTGYDTQATVVKVSDDTIWVKIPGGVDETPVAKTVSAKEGDIVQVRVADGRAWIMGNYTAPATDDTVAHEASAQAQSADAHAAIAEVAAKEAFESALTAQEAADVAKTRAAEATVSAGNALRAANAAGAQATIATNHANSALDQLGVVEDVVGTLEWITTHGTYVPTDDTAPVENKVYYTYRLEVALTEDATVDTSKSYYTADIDQVPNPDMEGLSSYFELVGGKYELTADTAIDPEKTYYAITTTLVDNPSQSALSTYYEVREFYSETPVESTDNPYELGLYVLQIDDAVSTYVNTHLALTDKGLYVLSDNGYKVLLSNENLQIISDDGATVATYGESIGFDETRGFSIGNDNVYIKYFDSNNDAVADAIAIKANEIIFGESSLGLTLDSMDSAITGVQSEITDVSRAVDETVVSVNNDIDSLDTRITSQDALIQKNATDIAKYAGYVSIDPTEPSIKVAADIASYLKLLPSKLSFVVANNEVVYLSNERLYAPSAVVNNLYMQTVDQTTGDTIGAIGWVMRSNGHLSMRRMR